MDELNIFPDVDEIIICNAPNGRKIEVNVYDLDDLINQMLDTLDISFRNSRQAQLRRLIQLFDDKYQYRMSTASMDALIALKERKMEAIKKNVSQLREQLGFTESNPEPTETSESSESAKQS